MSRKSDSCGTLYTAFSAAVRRWPDRVATSVDGRRVTYGALGAMAARAGEVLAAGGATPGARVVLLLPNGAEFVAAFMGALSCGAVVVPVDPSSVPRELAEVFDQVAPSVVVFDAPYVVEETRQFLAAWQDGQRRVVAAAAYANPCRAEQSERKHRRRSPTHRDADDVAVIFRTSGTSGTPKGVRHSHRTLLAAVEHVERLRAAFFDGPVLVVAGRALRIGWRHGRRLLRAAHKPVWMTPIPFHTIAGATVCLQALSLGHRLVTMRRFAPRRLLDVLVAERVTYFAAVPSMLELLLRVPDLHSRRFPDLLVVGLGGELASAQLSRRVKAAFGCMVAIGYGATELGGGILVTRIDDPDALQTETVGRPLPGTSVSIIDDQGEELAPGQIGELACRTRGLMLGYQGDPAGESHLLDGGLFRTGDLATMDTTGHVRIVGRKSEIIHHAGRKVSPYEIETVLEGHPAVLRAAVVGMPAAVGGQFIHAFVVPVEGRALTAGELLEHCRRLLAPYKMPARFEFRGALPLSASGKVARALLVRQSADTRAEVAALAGAGALADERPSR